MAALDSGKSEREHRRVGRRERERKSELANTHNTHTSNDTEELLNPHVDVDPAEELVHVAPPLLQDGAH